MRHSRLAVLAAAVLFIGPVLAQRPKPRVPCEVTPSAVVVAEPGPQPRPVPALTLPSPEYLQHPPLQFSEDPNVRMERLLKESEDLQQAREEFHRFWMNNQPSTLTYERFSERTVCRTYEVSDLVAPPTPRRAEPTEKPKTLERELIRKVTTNVEPKSWSAAGGSGTIEYFPLGMALVVNTTPTVHEAVQRYLEVLRKTKDLQVSTELVVMTVSDAWFQKAGLAKAFAACEADCTEGAARALCVKPEAVRKLVREAKESGGINQLTAPTIITLNGEPGRLTVGSTEHFVTGLTVKSVNGQVVYTPKNETHDLGLDLTIEPAVSADGTVKVAVSGGLKELAVRPVPMTPVTTQLRGTTADGKPAEVVPFTQFIQEPKVVTRTVSGTVTVADGGTALLYGGKTTIRETTKEPIAFAADVPVLQALFTRDKTATSTNHLLVVVTVHVIKPEACCEPCDACPACGGKLTKLLADYRRACKDGKADDARRLAIECLAIDPTCFGKK